LEPATALIRVARSRSRSPDRRRPYAVFVDHEEVGEVSRGQTTELPVTPGRRVLRVSIDFEHSRDWSVVLAGGEVVQFAVRPRGKSPSDSYIDLYLSQPTDPRAAIVPSAADVALTQRAVTRGGDVVAVWAHRSGYLRSFDPGSSSTDTEGFLLELAIYILVLPVLGVLRWVRHRVLFKRGWSVGVVRKRRFLWPKKLRLERYPDEAQARARAAQLLTEVESWPRS